MCYINSWSICSQQKPKYVFLILLAPTSATIFSSTNRRRLRRRTSKPQVPDVYRNVGLYIQFLEYWDSRSLLRLQGRQNWATSWENLLLPYENNKGADQPVHPRSLISAFVVRCLENIMPLVSITEIPSLYLASVTAQAGLSLPWSQNPQTGFLVMRLN